MKVRKHQTRREVHRTQSANLTRPVRTRPAAEMHTQAYVDWPFCAKKLVMNSAAYVVDLPYRAAAEVHAQSCTLTSPAEQNDDPKDLFQRRLEVT